MEKLPDELLELVFTYLSGYDLVQCSLACKRWYNIIQSNSPLWREAVLREKIPEDRELVPLYGDFVGKYGLWKTFYCLHTVRCNNWKNNRFRTLRKTGESWFFQGWSSVQDVCLIPTYTSNTVDVFKISKDRLTLKQQIELPIPGLEPTFLITKAQGIVASKSNIVLMYKRDKEEYILARMFACRSGGIIRFYGDIGNTCEVSEFIGVNYARCGMVRVIDFKDHMIWMTDYNSSRLFIVSDNEYTRPRWYIPDSRYKTGDGYICFWAKHTIFLSSIEGEIVFELTDVDIDKLTFNNKYISIKLSNRAIESYNFKMKKKLPSIEMENYGNLVLHNELLFVQESLKSSISCYDLNSGVEKWKCSYQLSGCPISVCRVSVILNKFIIFFHSQKSPAGTGQFTVLDIESSKILYTKSYFGAVLEISDRLFVTFSSRSENTEIGNTIDICCYI